MAPAWRRPLPLSGRLVVGAVPGGTVAGVGVADEVQLIGAPADGPVSRSARSRPAGPLQSAVASARRSARTPGRAASRGSTSASVVDQPTDTRSAAVGVDAHGLEHRRRLERLGRAGAARVGGDPGPVEPEQHGLRLDALHAEAHEVGEPAVGVAVDAERRRGRGRRHAARTRSVSAPLLRRLGLGARRRPAPRRRRRSRRSPARSRARPGGPAPGRRRRAAGGSRRPRRTSRAPDAGRPAELVGAHRQQVGAQVAGSRSARARRPGRRRRGRARPRSRQAGHDLGDRLERADLVVAPLHVDERGVGPDRRAEHGRRGRPDPAASTATMVTSPWRAAARRHRGVLDRGDDLVARPRSAAPQQAAAIASVAPLVNTTSRVRAPSRSATWLAGLLDRDPGGHALGVDAAGVAAAGRARATSSVAARLRPQRRGRGVVEVVPGGPPASGAIRAWPPWTAVTQRSPPMGSDGSVSAERVVAVEGRQHALDHAPVDRADDRVLDGGAAERAVLGRRCAAAVAVPLGVGGEPVGGEGVGHRVERRLERAVVRRSRGHRRGHRPAVVDPDLLGHAPRPARGRASASARPSSATSTSSWRSGSSRAMSGATDPVALRRPPGAAPAPGAGLPDLEVAAGGELVEVVAGDVGVEGRTARPPRPR